MKNIIKKLIKETIDEALRDELPDYMINAVKRNNPNLADKFLDMDVPKHTELIPNAKIELDEPQITKDFIKDIQKHFSNSIAKQFEQTKLFENFYKKRVIVDVLNKGLDVSVRDSHIYSKIFSNTTEFMNLFNQIGVKKVINSLKIFYSKEFPLLQGKDNNIDNPIFSKNKSNLFSFIKSFNTAFPQDAIDLNQIMNDRIFQGLREPIINYDQNVNDLVNTKLYLYITDKPADILRMSVSNFYSSCQNLYSGSHNEKLLSNVFDENSKIAFLIFDSPYVDNQGNKHPFTPISRTILRVGENNQILFDKTYPTQMEEDFYEILEKYTQLRNQGTRNSKYPYKSIGLPSPYMDRYKIKGGASELENNPRAIALADELGVDLNELEEISGAEFEYNNRTYTVYLQDEANEYARDYLRDNWIDFMDNKSFYEIVEDYEILDINAVFRVLNITPQDLDDMGLDFKDYLDDIGIKTLSDFNKFLKTRISKNSNYWQWYREGVTFDLDNVIEYFGGMGEARILANATYDGNEYYNHGYYIYMTD